MFALVHVDWSIVIAAAHGIKCGIQSFHCLGNLRVQSISEMREWYVPYDQSWVVNPCCGDLKPFVGVCKGDRKEGTHKVEVTETGVTG